MTDEPNENQEIPEDQYEPEPTPDPLHWTTRLIIVVCLVVVFAIAYMSAQKAGVFGDREVPEPYRAQLIALRNQNNDLRAQCVELTKKLGELQTQQNYNLNQMNLIGDKALQHEELSPEEYKLNVDTLKILKRSK